VKERSFGPLGMPVADARLGSQVGKYLVDVAATKFLVAKLVGTQNRFELGIDHNTSIAQPAIDYKISLHAGKQATQT